MNTLINWDHYAEKYDALLHLKPYTDMLHEVVAQAACQAGDVVLDVGCGTGNVTLALAAHNTTIHAVDNNQSMLAIAKQKCGASARFVQHDLDSGIPLAFATATFDRLVAVNVLYTLQNPKQFLREMQRLLKPGGTLTIATPKAGFENGLILKAHCGSSEPDIYWSNMHASVEREQALLCSAFSNRKLVEELLFVAACNRSIQQESRSGFRFYTKTELQELLEAIGFTICHCSSTYANQSHLITIQHT